MKEKKFVMTKETNLEHYLEQIKKIEDYDSFCIRKDDQALCACGEVGCNRCTFGDEGNCAIARIDWMAGLISKTANIVCQKLSGISWMPMFRKVIQARSNSLAI